MFDNLFSNSPAVWGGLIGGAIALPLLIHLINLMRHKTVQWAAMEFLLKSYKKNRNWVWLKQLLLLITRMLVLITALFLLAQIGCQQDRVAKLLGGAATHHYVILDDSFSMSDRTSSGSALDRARSTLSLIAARAKNRQNQLFTLVRCSALRNATESPDASRQPSFENSISQSADLNAVLVDNRFNQTVEETKARLNATQLAVNFDDALQVVDQLISDRPGENSIVYLVSDFRKTQWDNSENNKQLLSKITSRGAAVEMINCVEKERPNLAVTELEPVGNVRVAGTPLMMKLTVKNASSFPAEKVQIKLGTFEFPAPESIASPMDSQPKFTDVPTMFIENIRAGESESRTFPVFFDSPGQHAISSTLPVDAVAADNTRWSCTEIRATAKVLLVDGPLNHARYFSLALNPGNLTGISPVIRTREFLRDASPNELTEFDVIYLLDTEPLSGPAIANLETFAQAGGGVAFFLGPNTNLAAVNETLYREGHGLFPMPLDQVIDIPELTEGIIPDLSVDPHPAFSPLRQNNNSLLDLVQVKRVIRPPLTWSAVSQPDVSISATARGLQTWPVCVEKPFGKGVIFAFTTTAGPTWNNWSRNATFPAFVLMLNDYLAKGRYDDTLYLAGSRFGLNLDAREFQSEATLLTPDRVEGTRSASQRLLQRNSTGDSLLLPFGDSLPGSTRRDTDMPGIYDAWLKRNNQSQAIKRLAINVDTSESEMGLASGQELLASLDTANATFVNWNEFSPEPKQKPASSLSRLLLLILVAVLLAEQFLAYSTSYH